jgi:CDP-2,3-bis-(O-geranylgeranyl)-sn-glycerol synthase
MILEQLLLLSSAWVTNVSFSLLAKIFELFHLKDFPIDFGKNFFDGKRIFGDHRTVFVGSLGFFCGCIYGWYITGDVLEGLLIPLGAFIGALLGSFIKRRRNIPIGGASFPLDQIDFDLCAYSLSLFFHAFSLSVFSIFIFSTIIGHPLVCRVSNRLHIKSNPW